MKHFTILFFFFGLAVSLVAQTPATILLEEGQALAGGTITNLNLPFTNGNGELCTTGRVDIGGSEEAFIYIGSSVIFLDTDALPDVLTSGESYMGGGDNGEFIFSPSFNGSDAVYTHNGLLAVENTQAPDFPAGVNSTFHSRPRMAPDGTAYWIAGYNDGAGGTSSIGRMLYTATPAGVITKILAGGDVIMGQPIDDGSGVDFDYNFSDDNANVINVVNLDVGSTASDGAIIVNASTIVAQEASPNGNGDNWDNFDFVFINNNGDYVFSGDTDGSTSSDEFIAVNGSIQLREGSVVNGVTIPASSSVRGLYLNNLGQLLQLWGNGAGEQLFIGNIANLSTSTALVIQTGDQIDVDGNGIADFIIDDFNTFGQSIALTDDGRIYVEADYTPVGGGAQRTGILEFPSGTLPVSFLSFRANLNSDASVDLSWSTANEENNEGFFVERSSERRPDLWTELGFVSGRGDSQEQEDYYFIDANPLNGTNLYRLRQVDFDGSMSYSPIEAISMDRPSGGITVYPTIVDQVLRYQIPDGLSPNDLSINIRDMNGRVVQDYHVLNQRINLPTQLSSGQYIITFTTASDSWSFPFLKR